LRAASWAIAALDEAVDVVFEAAGEDLSATVPATA